jgi:hypothetical protein
MTARYLRGLGDTSILILPERLTADQIASIAAANRLPLFTTNRRTSADWNRW